MPNTFTLIAAVTVGSGGASNITFSSIPSTYTDLNMVFSVRSNSASAGSGLYESLVTRINGSSTSGDYYSKVIRADGNGGITNANYQGNVGWILPGTYVQAANSYANSFSNFSMYFPNYLSSSGKSMSSDGSATAYRDNPIGANSMGAGLYSPSTAISSISISPEYGSAWVENSSAYLYGIKNS